MELSIRLIAVSIAAIWVLRCAWKLLNWVYLRPNKVERLLRQQGLNGTPYKLVFGDLVDLVRMRNQAWSKPMDFSNHILPYMDPFVHQSINTHGENAFIWFGPIPILMITQPELIREVFSKIDDFLKVEFSLLQIIAPGVAVLEGERWAKHRKLINPAFHMEKLKIMMPMFVTSCNEMMNKWERMVSRSGSIDLDLWPQFDNMTNDIIAKAAFSTSYEEGRRAFAFAEEQIQIFFRSKKQMFIPGWRYVPTSTNRKFNKLEKQIRNSTKDIIDKRRIEMEEGSAAKNDFLDTLMRSKLTEMGSKESEPCLTVEELIDECKILYVAGHETTTTLLSYTMILLAKHSNWQTKARDEVLKAFGDAAPDFDGLNKLKIVTMILNEVLRLYPPAPWTWRRVIRDTKLGKWCLPKGTYLNLLMIYSHHDPRYWGDNATKFNPDRFSRGILEATEEKFVFTPFASGPRVCVGQNLALIEAKMALAMILQRFWFEPSPSYAHSPFMIISTRPQFGAHVILHHL